MLTNLAFGYYEYITYSKYIMFATDQAVSPEFDKFRCDYFSFFGFGTDKGAPPQLRGMHLVYALTLDDGCDEQQLYAAIVDWTRLMRGLSTIRYIQQRDLLRTWSNLKLVLCASNPKFVNLSDVTYDQFELIQRTHRTFMNNGLLLPIGTCIIVRPDSLSIGFFIHEKERLDDLVLCDMKQAFDLDWDLKTKLGSIDQTCGMLNSFTLNRIISNDLNEQAQYVHCMWDKITQLFQ